MAKKSILFLAVYGVFLIWPFIFPPAGVWGYMVEWYNHPAYQWWGADLIIKFGDRWGLMIGIVMIGSVVLHYSKYAHIPFIKHWQTILMIGYTINAYLLSTMAQSPEESYYLASTSFKLILLYWCIVKTHSDTKMLKILIVICIIGCFNWGLDVTLGADAAQYKNGRMVVKLGAPGTWGENFIAPHVVAFLPLLGVFIVYAKGLLKLSYIFMVPFIINLIAHAASRGAFLALLTAAGSTLFFSKGSLRKWILVGCLLGVIVSFRLFPQEFWERQQTMTTYEEDASAMGRIYAWKAAWIAIKDQPYGYGGDAFELGLGASLMPDGYHTTHNMLFETWVSWGIQGVICLYGFIFLSLYDCYRLYKYWWSNRKRTPSFEGLIAFGIMCGLISMLVSSVFLNRYRWELWWVFAGMTVCLKNIRLRQEFEKQVNTS